MGKPVRCSRGPLGGQGNDPHESEVSSKVQLKTVLCPSAGVVPQWVPPFGPVNAVSRRLMGLLAEAPWVQIPALSLSS